MNTWKCSICGEVIYHQVVPEICPRCGVGADFFEQIETNHEQHNSHQKIVIIGGGIAGFTVAKTLREVDKSCQIDMFTMEKEPPYDRTKLSKELFMIQHATFELAPRSWYDEQSIHLHTDCEVIEILAEQHAIKTVYGGEYSYDKLVLAMGSHAFIPPIPNTDLENIHTLRTIQDAKDIIQHANHANHAIIVGGGILGLETACSLAQAHIQVEIVETLPSLMAKQLDSIGSEVLTSYMKEQKIRIHTNTSVSNFHGRDKVESVELSSGTCIPVDFVILSAGVRSSLSLLKHTDIEHDAHIFVNEHMETNIKDIYACGDVCSYQGSYDGLWPTAQMQAQVVARTITNTASAYEPIKQPLYFNREDFSMMAMGDIHQMDQYIECLDEPHKKYEKLCYNEEICSGILLINCKEHVEKAIQHYQEKGKFPKEKGVL